MNHEAKYWRIKNKEQPRTSRNMNSETFPHIQKFERETERDDVVKITNRSFGPFRKAPRVTYYYFIKTKKENETS